MKEKEQVTIEELLEGPDMEESPLELLCLSELNPTMSSEEIKFQQLIKKLLEESKHIIKSIQQDLEEDK
jgi:hypothetical protein